MKKIIFTVLISVLLCGNCCAELVDENAINNALPESARELTNDFSIDNPAEFKDIPEKLLNMVKTAVTLNLNSAVKNGVSIVLVAFICSFLGIFGNENTPDYITLCGCAAISVICAGSVNSYINSCSDTINNMSIFSTVMLPALCTLGAATGAVTSATVKYAASAFFMDLLVNAVKDIILPLVYIYIAVSVASAAFQNKSLAGVSKLIKQLCTIFMTALTIVFTAYLSISSAIASSSDAVALRLAKTAISTALPVVGGILSDAASSVVAGAELIKAGAGAFGLIASLAICIGPFVAIGLNFLVFKASAICINALNESRIASVAEGIGTAYGLLLGCVGSCGIIMFISILSCVRAVTG